MTPRASSTTSGTSASSPREAPVSAVMGLNATLPISFSQSWSRMLDSIGHFNPPATNASAIARHRSVCAPSGSPIAKRVPSTCLTTPGASSSAAGYETQPTTRDASIDRETTPPGSTLSRTVPSCVPPNDWKNHQGTPFCAGNTTVSSPSTSPRRGAISGSVYAFTPRTTTSASATASSSSVAGTRASKSPRGDRTRTPRSRSASSCGPRAISTTSAPPRASAAPM